MKIGTDMELNTTSLDDFLKDTFSQEFLDEAEIEYALARIAAHASTAKAASGLSIREVANRMGSKSPAVVQRIVDEGSPHNVTVATLARFAHACDYELRVEFAPRNRVAGWLEQAGRLHDLGKWRSASANRNSGTFHRDPDEEVHETGHELAA
jgi:hypothetical protein